MAEADLARYEQELLRRNAALEERAAASIARAKAVVEGTIPPSPGAADAPDLEEYSDVDDDPNDDDDDDDDDARARPPTPPQAKRAEVVAAAAAAKSPSKQQPPAAAKRATAASKTRARASSGDAASIIRASASASAAPDLDARDHNDAWEDAYDEDKYGRLARARIRALQDELAAQARELREAHARLKERDVELKRLLTEKLSGAFYLTPVPIRPRRRGERRSLRTFPGASLRPGSLAHNPDTSRRLSTPLLTPLNSTPTSSLAWTLDPQPPRRRRRSRRPRTRSARRRSTRERSSRRRSASARSCDARWTARRARIRRRRRSSRRGTCGSTERWRTRSGIKARFRFRRHAIGPHTIPFAL
jgi:hypothetical protein